MWDDEGLLNMLKMFLPPTSQIILLDTPCRKPAVYFVDIDGDNILELVAAYRFQGEIYIVILKYYNYTWHVMDTVKGKGYNFEYPYPSIEKLTELKKQICDDRQLSNKYGIDFSSIKYISSETKKDVQLEKAIVKAFDLSSDMGNIRYYYNKVDLNDDGNPEVFVYLVGPYVCGTGGCSAAIFKNVEKEYSVISTFSLVNNPIIISNKKTNGYKDLIMHVSGGGIESFFADVKYDGTTYPSNPSIQPKVKMGAKVEGIAIISDDISKNLGIELTNFNRAELNVKMGAYHFGEK